MCALTLSAQAFVRVEKRDAGWTFVDSDGAAFVHRGVGWVSRHGPRNVRTKVQPYHETVQAKYADDEAWCRTTVGRLRDWGFNAVGSDSDRELRHRGLRHTILLRMGAEPATAKRDPDDYILPHRGGPCSAFPNVFSSKFPEFCDAVAARMCAPNREDGDLVGYFIDNELAWWGPKEVKVRDGTGLVDVIAALPATHSARAALDAFAASCGKSGAGALDAREKETFLGRVAERYFAVTCAAIRKADPNHLVLGCRFAGMFGAHPVVWEAAGRHCDVVTVNQYPTVDFKTRRITARHAADNTWVDWLDTLEGLQKRTGKPVMITEWSFPAKDSGLPCRHGAGQRLNWQGERARAVEIFIRSALDRPFVVGYDFFMWTDMPNSTGCEDYPGEDCNYGLVNAADEPYARVVETFRRVQRGEGWFVTVDGRPLPLNYVKITARAENEPATNALVKGDWHQFGTFSLDRPAQVRIVCDRPIAGTQVLPRASVRQVAENFRREGERSFAFTARGPFRLSFLPQGRVGALHLVAAAPDPVAVSAKSGQGRVRVFGPGEHHERLLSVRSGETLVIDEGAVVYGHLDVRGSDITVCGGGVISGGDWPRHEGPMPYSNAILSSTNVTVRGITLTQAYTWTLGIRDSKGVTIEGLSIAGSNMVNDDGIDIVNSSDVTVRRAFIRTQDDNICTKGLLWREGALPPPVENVLVEDCVLWTDQANVFRFGFECDAAYMKGVRIRNVDVLRYSPFFRPFSDIWCHAVFKIQTADGLVFSGLDVDGVRVESDGGDVCLVVAEPRPTWTRRRKERYAYTRGGKIRDCRFANIAVTGKKEGFTGWIYLKGRGEDEDVSDIRFENVTYFGEPVLRDSPAVRIEGPHVKNVRFLK